MSEVPALNDFWMNEYINRLRNDRKEKDPKSLIPYGYKIYSQSDEDGIINEIFSRIGTTNNNFIEIGVGDGLENNTVALLFQNWHGIWIEASAQKVRKIKNGFKHTIDSGRLQIKNSFVCRENIDQILSPLIKESDLDLLSVDIDGNYYHIISAISGITPRVIVVEYNAKFPPPIEYCINYIPTHRWNGTDCFGASLKFLEKNLSTKNYSLVGCCLSGFNAFFVRNDLVSNHFSEPFTAEHHYEPPRYYLFRNYLGHPTSYQTLENALRG